MELKFKTLSLPQIIRWCNANGETEWAKNCRKEKEFPVYPTEKHTITRGQDAGKVIIRKVPNSAPIGTEKRIPSTRDIINAFCEDFKDRLPADFYPESKAPKKVSMDELIAAIGTRKYDELEKAYEAYNDYVKEQAKKRKAGK